MMAQSSYRVRSVGDYLVGKQIGSGSFSVVWQAHHKIHGTEVAIKEINTGRLNKKLEESLMSEIYILKNIHHPNIIRLLDIIKEPGKLHLVLEYCKGGDLSMFIQRHQGQIPESTAVHFMQQLAAGLKVLHENQIIHRDLKPQNLLLCRSEDNSTLKIADFGFARSLQDRRLAETLCGSPLYMAPEIMNLQKYDAQADLWSVGAILFQLVTGRPPFTGINQIQLLRNIMKSTELQFPSDAKNLSPACMDLCQKLLRQDPAERLTFEAFFTHPFFSREQPDELLRNRRPQRRRDDDSRGHQEDYLPFSLDDDCSGLHSSPTSLQTSPLRSTYGFSKDNKDMSEDMEINIGKKTTEYTGSKLCTRRPSEGNLKECLRSMDHRSVNFCSEVEDSLDLIIQDYVLVSGPLGDTSSLPSLSKLNQSASKSGNSRNILPTATAPLAIVGGVNNKVGCTESLESQCTVPSGTSHGSIDMIETSSINCMASIKSLHHCASAIMELVNEKIEAGQQLEAFSIQLVILAIWKQALDICQTEAASAVEGSPGQDSMRSKESTSKACGSPDIQEYLETTKSPQDMCCHIEKIFLSEVEKAEELAQVLEPGGNVGMPDAMETIFQAALTFGKHGAVDEYMGYAENAAALYSKAVDLFNFLLAEAPSLILSPPFSLTNSDRYRLRTYIDVLNNRQRYSTSQRMALLKGDHQHCPP